MIVSSNGKFVMKTLLAHLNQQYSLPLIMFALEFVNNPRQGLETKVINYWNSVGDMLNKKFKGALQRNRTLNAKSSALKQKCNGNSGYKIPILKQNRQGRFNDANELQYKVLAQTFNQINFSYENLSSLKQMNYNFNNFHLSNYKHDPSYDTPFSTNCFQNSTASASVYVSLMPNSLLYKPAYNSSCISYRQNQQSYFYASNS